MQWSMLVRSMRMGGAILALATMTGGAHASSFVTLEATEGPVSSSMIVIGDSRPAGMSPSFQTVEAVNAAISSSMVAFGEPVPNVTYEKVAAVPAASRKARRREQPPMVMRGGLIGEAFPVARAGQFQPAEAAPRKAGQRESRPPQSAVRPPEPELITE